MSVLSCSRFAIVLAIAITLSITMHGQIVQDTESRPGKLIGTVTDVNGDPVANATVTLETPESQKCWCREGELNPQGAKHRRILSPLQVGITGSAATHGVPIVNWKKIEI